MKNKKLKTLTTELSKTWELKNMTGFQFTFGEKQGDIITGHFSFNFSESDFNGIRAVQTSCEETNIAPLINKILNFKKSLRYAGEKSYDFTSEEFKKIEKVFEGLGHEVESVKVVNKEWTWLRIKNSNKDIIELQLAEIASKFHSL